MTFRPWHDRVVLGRIEPENKTADGILIPDTAKQKVQEGEVLASVPAPGTLTGAFSRWTSRRATACCLARGRALKSTSRVSNP
jgi:hypothetical protein